MGEIERLVDGLDSTIDVDGDFAGADDEPVDSDGGDLEPSLGAFDRMSSRIKTWQTTI